MDPILNLDVWSKIERWLRPSRLQAPAMIKSAFASNQLKKLNEQVYEVYNSGGSLRPSLEVVFFHGLQLELSNERHLTSWLSEDKSELWLSWLLDDIPDIRLLIVSYDATSERTDAGGCMDMSISREELLLNLISPSAHVGQNECPVILVGHSLGGLVAKEVCLLANTFEDCLDRFALFPHGKTRVRNFLENVKGFFFYATPHRSADILPHLTASRSIGFRDGPLLKDITPLNEQTRVITEDFHKLAEKWNWKAAGVGEADQVITANFTGFVVQGAPSRLGLDSHYTVYIKGDHFQISHPRDRTSPSFSMLLEFIVAMYKLSKDSSAIHPYDPYREDPHYERPVVLNLPWRKGAQLGAGSFGTVFEAVDQDGVFFAVKEVSLTEQDRKSQDAIAQLRHEIDLLSSCRHPKIVQYMGTEATGDKLSIFLELVARGSLVDIYSRWPLSVSQIRAYTKQILKGLRYLHKRHIFHRDIKCANILVGTLGVCKLADFGMARQMSLLDETKSAKGSYCWMAPEVFHPKMSSSFPADIWSLGCSIIEMATRAPPFGNMHQEIAVWQIVHGIAPPIPETLPEDAQDFIRQCLQTDPNTRPNVNQLLEHPFVNVH